MEQQSEEGEGRECLHMWNETIGCREAIHPKECPYYKGENLQWQVVDEHQRLEQHPQKIHSRVGKGEPSGSHCPANDGRRKRTQRGDQIDKHSIYSVLEEMGENDQFDLEGIKGVSQQ